MRMGGGDWQVQNFFEIHERFCIQRLRIKFVRVTNVCYGIMGIVQNRDIDVANVPRRFTCQSGEQSKDKHVV